MTNGTPADLLGRPRVLLAGEPSARPQGLERALARSGFRLWEAGDAAAGDAPDAILVTVASADPALLGRLLDGGAGVPPRVVLVAGVDPEAPAAALAAGADDALAAPVHLPELCARLQARIRDRQAPRRTPREQAARGMLEGMVEQVCGPLRPDEVVLAIVRRVARAFGLRACAFVAVAADGPRMVASVGAEECPDLADHPAIAEAARSRRTVAFPAGPQPEAQGGLLALPAAVDDRMVGVLLLRPCDECGRLSAAQLELAEGMAGAAAAALAGPAGAGARPVGEEIDRLTGCATAVLLDRRLDEEFERARRYALSFSLVLLDVDALAEINQRLGPEAGDRLLRAMAARLRRELRLPDFVCRYGGDEFALVLPETGADGARRSVARIRAALAAVPLDPVLAGERPRLSAGIVTYPHPAAARPDDLCALVEAGLARAKAQAGERVATAE